MKGKLNVGRFLDRALIDNMFVLVVDNVIESIDGKEFDLQEVQKFYSPLEKDMCYNFNGFAVYGREIDIV